MIHELATKGLAFATEHLFWRVVLSVVSFFVLQLFGVLESGHFAVGILIILDTLTGFWKYAKQNKVKSRYLFMGAFRKIVMYALFVMAIHQLVVIEPKIQFLQDWSFLFLGATELLSILENLHEVGLFIPKWLSKYLHQILDRNPLNT